MKIVGNQIPFSKVSLRTQRLRPITMELKHRVNGLDIETLNGYARLIADHEGNYILCDNIDDILKYLTHYRFRSAHNFYFNLRFDTNAIIKYLSRENLTDLWKEGRTEYEDYKIGYIPKKLLKITRDKHIYKFFDIAQFYETSLEVASKKYLGMRKNPGNIDRKKLGTSARYWEDRLPDITKYCILDSLLAKKLGDLLQDTLIEKVELTPQNYISKASVSKEYVRKNTIIPDIRHIDNRVLRMAFNSYHGGRFEVIQKGAVGLCTLIDINSAYPSVIRNLVDVEKGVWKAVKSLHENAIYGYYLVKVATRYRNICPLAYQHTNLVTCYPVIEYATYLTKSELLAYEDDIIYEIIRGWEYYDDRPSYPFRHIIDNLYRLKQETPKEHYEYKLYKKIMNSMYGSFYEKTKKDDIWRAGKLFNPIYATEITANTRIQCYTEAKKHPHKVVGFATDSLLIKGKVDMPETKALGQWSIESSDKAIVLKSGIYRIGKKIKKRGMPKKTKLLTPTGEYKDIFEYILKQPHLEQYPIIIHRPVNFVEAMLHTKKRTLDDINVFIDHDYIIDINKDHKRLWDDTFDCGGELYQKKVDSQPLIIM